MILLEQQYLPANRRPQNSFQRLDEELRGADYDSLNDFFVVPKLCHAFQVISRENLSSFLS